MSIAPSRPGPRKAAAAGLSSAPDDPVERARRERVRERASGIVAFSTDAGCSLAAFTLAGVVYLADLTGHAEGIRSLGTRTPAADPRPSPDGPAPGRGGCCAR